MKKPIMSKRRFEGGGEVEDKAAGLEASNKEKPMGFFERLRMGNIDDPESEAYKRLGAGRGAAERIPVEDKSFTDVKAPSEEVPVINNRAKDMASTYASVQARKNAEAEGEKITEGERIAQEMASKPDRVVEPTKVVKKPAIKDTSNYSNEGRYKSPVGTSTAKDTSNYSNEGRYKSPTGTSPSAKTEAKTEAKSEPKKEMYRTMSGKMAEKTPDYGSPLMGLGETVGRGAKAIGDVFSKYEFMTPAKRIAKENKENKEARGYKAGGSISKASSRADGIAQRGKTRGVMR
jgi:hypothetical protein